MGVEELMLVAGALLIAGLGLSLLAGRLRLPSLVLFLGLGMAIGSDGTGWIDFSDYALAQHVGVVALALILFEGGLTTTLHEVRPVLGPSLALAIVGTLITAAITGLVAAQLFDYSTTEGLLLGSILASTDGAAVFAVLRGSTLRRRVARTLEGEAGFNDPIAVLLVLGFIGVLTRPGYGAGDVAVLFLRELGIGAVLGTLVGLLAARGLQRLPLPSPGLYPVASLAAAGVSYGAAATAHGSGFLAVFITGLLLGEAGVPGRGGMRVFHEALGWVAQIGMFFALGLLVFPARLDAIALSGTALALLLVFVARPLAAYLVTVRFGFSTAERLLLGWAGLRGAVPVVLATFPVLAGVHGSGEFFNVAFFVVLLSTVLQGATIDPFARLLRASNPARAVPKPLVESGTIRALGAEIVPFAVEPGDAAVGHRIRELGLPREALVNVIVRRGEAIPPRGSTVIEAGDELHVLVRGSASGLAELERHWREGPMPEPPRRRPALRAHPAAFTSRPWEEGFGDPADPRSLLDVPVVERLRTRRDRPGALLALADGRYAVSGSVLAVGNRAELERHARRSLRAATSEDERVWWQEVIGALAA